MVIIKDEEKDVIIMLCQEGVTVINPYKKYFFFHNIICCIVIISLGEIFIYIYYILSTQQKILGYNKKNN